WPRAASPCTRGSGGTSTARARWCTGRSCGYRSIDDLMHAGPMDSSREVVTLSRIGAGHYVIAGGQTPTELRMSRWRSRAAATVAGRRYELRRTGFFDRGVTVTDQNGVEVLVLSRRNPNVPGLAECEWRIRSRWRGYEARLTCAATMELTIRTGYGGRSNV